ncbi:MAG: Fic family protein [Sphingobacteriales bacterium]|nr:MAG: Fic family protein [Sphingobacteriales bacterium]
MIDNLINEIAQLKIQLNDLRHLQSYKIAQALDIEYTYESNKIEGNTLTLQETQLVIEKGLTIGGKPLKEHLEATNHYYAIEFIKQLVEDKTPFTETILLQIHQLILQGIDNHNAGKYRNVQVLISGAKHIPPQPYLVPKQMESFFIWYNEYKDKIHPVVLSAEMHQRLVTIHPFIDGNGRTSRLLMNLILIQNGYPIAILKGDVASRLKYYECLEIAQTENNNKPFIEFIAENIKNTMNRILKSIN